MSSRIFNVYIDGLTYIFFYCSSYCGSLSFIAHWTLGYVDLLESSWMLGMFYARLDGGILLLFLTMISVL